MLRKEGAGATLVHLSCIRKPIQVIDLPYAVTADTHKEKEKKGFRERRCCTIVGTLIMAIVTLSRMMPLLLTVCDCLSFICRSPFGVDQICMNIHVSKDFS